jgi:hypothetical protein
MKASPVRVGRSRGASILLYDDWADSAWGLDICQCLRDCGVNAIEVHWYQYTTVRRLPGIRMPIVPKRFEVERVQTGIRMERRILKVLKALAEYKNITLGDLLEGMVLHAFEGKTPFSVETVRKIAELKNIYELDLDARASHRLKEK